MEFVPLYHKDRLTVINPAGNIGIVTLWTKVDVVYNLLVQAGMDLSPAASKVAVMSNLYGNGLPQMLRNLLYNPQIDTLVICGKNLSGSGEWLSNFFTKGLEEADFLGEKVFQISGTQRVIDGGVRPEHFARSPSVHLFGAISEPDTIKGMCSLIGDISPISAEVSRIEPPPIPEPKISRYPSHPGMHSVRRRRPTEAWRELVFRIYRFGDRTKVAKSTGVEERIELLNTQVVVDEPREESAAVLADSGFSLEKFRAYQTRILDPAYQPELSYSYGHLMRTGLEHESVDSLAIIVERLKKDNDSRHAYATLWNNNKHLPWGKKCPCLVTLFFRFYDKRLNLTATFRAHNTMDGWLENFYGLMAIQQFVSEGTGLPSGSITVISHSITIDPAALDRAKRIAGDRVSDDDHDLATGKRELRLDPNGAFTVTFDSATWELVVEHSYQGMKIGEYRGASAEVVEIELIRDLAVSLPSHALYLGRTLARMEFEMKKAKSQKA